MAYYTERKHIKYLYCICAFLFFCIFWIAVLNVRDMQIWIGNNKTMNKNIDEKYEQKSSVLKQRVDFLSDVERQNARLRK